MALKKRDEAIDDFNRKINRLEREYREVKGENSKIKGYLGVLSAVVIILAILSVIVINLTGFSIFNEGGTSLETVHYAMNDNDYSYDVVDSSGNGHTGASSGGSYTISLHTSSGKIGNAFAFPGQTEYITVGSSTGMLSSDFTVSFWANPTEVSGNREWFSKRTAGVGDGFSIVSNGGQWYELASHGGSTWDIGPGSYGWNSIGTATANTWQLVTVVKSGSNWNLYVNDVLSGSSFVNESNIYSNGQPIKIGGGNGDAAYASGKIDDLRIYDVALTQEQITAIYNSTIISGGAEVAHWSLGESGGDTNIPDSFGRFAGTSTILTMYMSVAGKLGQAKDFSGAVSEGCSGDHSACSSYSSRGDTGVACTSHSCSWLPAGDCQTPWNGDQSGCESHTGSPWGCSPQYSADPYTCGCPETNTCACNPPSTCACNPPSTCSCGDSYTCACYPSGDPMNCGETADQPCETNMCSCGDPYTCGCPETNNCACTETNTCPCNPASTCSCGAPYANSCLGGWSDLCYSSPHVCSSLQHDACVADSGDGCIWTSAASDKHIVVPYNDALNPATLSVCAWVQTSATYSGWGGVVTLGDNSWRLLVSGANNGGYDGKANFGTTGPSQMDLIGNINVGDGLWHYICGVFDGSTKYLYVDGSLDTSAAATGSISATTADLWIGANSGSSQSFVGNIDDVRLYNYSLSSSQVSALYGSNSEGSLSSGLTAPMGTEANLAAAAVVASSNPSDKAIAHYKMNDNSADANVVDSSGNGYTGTATTTTDALTTTGKINGALNFSGAEGVNIGNIKFMSENFTISSWIKAPSWVDNGVIIGRGLGGGNDVQGDIYFATMSDGSIHFTGFDSTGWALGYYGGATLHTQSGLSADTWYNVIVTREGTTYKIYLDGVEQTTGAGGGSPQTDTNSWSDASNGNDVKINSYSAAYGATFNGIVDDVRIYNYSLNSSQIAFIYNGGSGTELDVNDSSGGSSSPMQLVYYTLDDAAASKDVVDSSGNGYTGTATANTDTLNTTGKIGSALQFDGSSNVISASGTGMPTGNEARSISAWVNFNSLSGAQGIAGTTGTTGSYILGYYNNAVYIFNGVGSEYNEAYTFSTGQWYLVTSTFDGTNEKLYVNGQLLGSGRTFDYSGKSSNHYVIAGAYGGNDILHDNWFNGKMDDVRMYNYALSASNISSLYNEGLGNVEVLHYKMNDNSASVKVIDSSAFSYNGTATANTDTLNTTGKINGALNFDGSTTIDAGSTSIANFGADNFSISTWFYPTSNPAVSGLISDYNSSDGEYTVYLCSNHVSFGGIFFATFTNADNQITLYPAGGITPTLNQWHNIMVIRTGDSLNMYYDDSLVATSDITGITLKTPTVNLEVGTDNAGHHFIGSIDDTRIYNYALNSSDIAFIYNSGSGTELDVNDSSVSMPSSPMQLVHYALDDNLGTTNVIDSDGSYNGTATADTDTLATTGKVNGALKFDGSTDYVNISSLASSLPSGASSISVSSWVYINGATSAGCFFHMGDNSATNGHHRALCINEAPSGNLFSVDTFGTAFFSTTTTPSLVGTWAHVVYVYNGTDEELYINNNLENSRTFTPLFTNTDDAEIGTYIYSSTPVLFFNGSVDDVRIYNYALNSSQVSDLYNNATTADTNAPVVVITSPQQNANYGTRIIDLNYSASDDVALDSCWYSFDAGMTPSAIQVCGTNWTGLAALDEGDNRWTVYVNDTAGNTNSTDVFFFVDSLAPSINFTSPTPSGTINGNSIYVNLTTTDASEHYSFLDFDRSLSLWMRMDDVNSSGDPTDLSSYSINGTAKNGAVQTNSGKFGKGFSFDGANDYIDVPITGSNPTTALTVSVWVKLNQFRNYEKIIQRDGFATAGKNSWQLYAEQNNRTFFVISNGTTQYAPNSLVNSLVPDQWYQIVGTYNGSTVALYVNGVLNVSRNDAPAITFSAPSYRRISSADVNNGINGTADEVMIFNRSLSASEVASLYTSTADQYSNNFTGLGKGSHSFTGYAIDSYGNKNSTETRIVTLVDTTAPRTSIIYPVNVTYPSSSFSLNYSASDETALDSCWYSLNGGANSTAQTCNTNWTGLTATEGSNNVFVYANDTSGNVGSSSLTFIIDLTNPGINFTNPTSSGTINGDAIYVNLTTSDESKHYSFLNLDNSLVGWWRGENTADDELGLHNASWVGTSIYGAGEFGSAFSFNRANGYVNTSYIFNESTFSASVWFKANSLVNGSNILNNGFYSTDTSANGANRSWQLRLGWGEGAKVLFCLGNNTDGTCLGNSSNYLGLPGYLVANNWYHVVVVYNGSNGNTSFYLNGIMNWSDSRPNMNVSNEALIIGKDPGVIPNTIFDGLIDDVLMFNRTLTSAEVASLYNAQANKYENNFTGLDVGSHSFTGYVVDAAGNKNSTETRTVTLETLDTTAPRISIVFPMNTTYTNNSLTLNYTVYDNVALDSCWYSLGGAVNYSFDGGCGHNATLFGAPGDGSNVWRVWANDTSGNVNSSSVTFFVDLFAPMITVTSPANITYTNSNVTINFTSEDYDGNSISSRWFYNGTGNMTYNGVTSQILTDGQYVFVLYTNDTSGNVNSTSVTFSVNTANTGLPSCLAQCTEGSSCIIGNACHLDSSMCSGDLCQFTNLTISAQLKTGTDDSGNGKDLAINVTSTASSPVTFLSGGAINFSGKSGVQGGNAGIVNITVYNLFNTTNAFFYGTGGDSSGNGLNGGNGGTLNIIAHGIIRNFNDDIVDPNILISNAPVLIGGGSDSADAGNDGGVVYTKSLRCPRDVDVTADGSIDVYDAADTKGKYNDKSSEEGYVPTSDINCDNNINVIELSREGLQWNTR